MAADEVLSAVEERPHSKEKPSRLNVILDFLENLEGYRNKRGGEGRSESNGSGVPPAFLQESSSFDAAAAVPRIGEETVKTQVEARHFEAPLCSFQDLVNAPSTPITLAEALERVTGVASGPNFVWDKKTGKHPECAVSFDFAIVIWQPNSEHPDRNTRVVTKVSFIHRPGRAYLYQPVMPVTGLLIRPRPTFRPLFELDPRSFHLSKVAWRRFFNFDAIDHRMMVGDQLEKWTKGFTSVIEKPMDFTYWLMIMVGSFYKQSLIANKILPRVCRISDRVPVAHVDSFVSLSALVFAPARQVLFGGTSPGAAYLLWLRSIADQSQFRKDEREQRRPNSQFDMNEFLDLPALVVHYGLDGAKKNDDEDELCWLGHPEVVKKFIARFVEDNHCASQLEEAIRLYTQSCSLGRLSKPGSERSHSQSPRSSPPCSSNNNNDNNGNNNNNNNNSNPRSVGSRQRGESRGRNRKLEGGSPRPKTEDGASAEQWYCWNGLPLCEVGVPMPCTHASFLSPFTTSRSVAMMCPQHGYQTLDDESKKNKVGGTISSKASTNLGGTSTSLDLSMKVTQSTTIGSPPSIRQLRGRQSIASSSTSQAMDMRSSQSSRQSVSSAAGGYSDENDSEPYSGDEGETSVTKEDQCPCARYLRSFDAQQATRKTGRAASAEERRVARSEAVGKALSALMDFSVLHSFAALLAGGLNLSKQVIRLHFSIDPKAYAHLPTVARNNWQNGVLPWYHEFHRPDQHGRSRYSMLLVRVLRGLMGDGYLGGMLSESLDTVHARAPTKESTPNHQFSRDDSTYDFMAASGEAQSSSPSASTSLPGAYDALPPHTEHFASFNQWCHSAHLIPFLVRVYRRCGVAGLASNQHVGNYKHGADRRYPLVLPTVNDFCYGHCYPFHRILQYYYGGMDKIVCSCDDAKEVDADRALLGLIPGQERLNSQCWFKTLAPFVAQETRMTLGGFGQLAQTGKNFPMDFGSLNPAAVREALSKDFGRLRRRASGLPDGLKMAQDASNRRKMTDMSTQASRNGSGQSSRHGGARKRGMRGPTRGPAHPGELVAEDSFFWFTRPNIAVNTYPAQDRPRAAFSDPMLLKTHYTDFVSRTGTPVSSPRGSRDNLNLDLEDSATSDIAIPPSICLCQRTELSSHVRQRWEVEKVIVDEKGMLLGDCNLFPGAYGYRFTFEVKSDNVDKFVRASEVPVFQIFYMEYVRYQKSKHGKQRVTDGTMYFSESESDDDIIDNVGLPALDSHRRHSAMEMQHRRAQRKLRRKKAEEDEGVPQMLPVLVPHFNFQGK